MGTLVPFPPHSSPCEIPPETPPMPFVALDQLTPQPVDWLWPGRLARGHLHMLDGDPGLGKSLVLLDVAARLTAGRPLPDGAPARPPAPVIVLNAEDAARDTIHPRLAAAGADLGKVVVWDRRPGEAWPSLPHGAGALDAVVQQTGAALVVLDPLMAFLGPGVNAASDPSVRQALAPLADMAARRRCAVVLIRHLTKAAGRRALYRGQASIAFVAACRIAWLIGPDPKVVGQQVLAQAKNNLDPAPPSLAYAIDPPPPPAPGEGPAASPIGVGPRVRWLGESVWTDADLVTAVRGGPRTRAQTVLRALLRDGPQPAHALKAAARARGVSERTLQRAARALKVRFEATAVGTRAQVNYWRLPDGAAAAGADELEPWLRRLEEQHPPREAERPEVG